MAYTEFDGTLDPVPDGQVADLISAIRSVESGGKTNARSKQGANGSMQIMPATFRQYAMAGEDYGNDAHRTNAAVRKIQSDFEHYGGDVAKTAAAYLGGRGAVTKDGAIRNDVADANGTTPLSYAAMVQAKMAKSRSSASGKWVEFDGKLDDPESLGAGWTEFSGQLDTPKGQLSLTQSRDDYRASLIDANPSARPAAIDAMMAQYDEHNSPRAQQERRISGQAARELNDIARAKNFSGMPADEVAAGVAFQNRLDQRLRTKNGKTMLSAPGYVDPASGTVMTDAENQEIAEARGLVEELANAAGPEGGFSAAVKRGIGSTIQGAGQIGADYLPGVGQDNAVSEYGRGIINDNPAAVNSLADIADKPWMAAKEATGAAVPSMGAMLGARAVGMGITALSPFAGPGAPVVAGIGQLVANAGPIVAASLPSYSGIRDAQIKADPANAADGKSKAIALLGAGTVGAIETAFGPQEWALAAMKKGGIEALAKKFEAKTIAASIGKGFAKGAAVEGAEELVQNPIEQISGYQDPTTRKAIGETLFGGAMGAIGGGVVGGAMAGGATTYANHAPVGRQFAAELQRQVDSIDPRASHAEVAHALSVTDNSPIVPPGPGAIGRRGAASRNVTADDVTEAGTVDAAIVAAEAASLPTGTPTADAVAAIAADQVDMVPLEAAKPARTPDPELDHISDAINAQQAKEAPGAAPVTIDRASESDVKTAIKPTSRILSHLIAKAFGKEIVYVRGADGQDLFFNGLYGGSVNGADPSKIYINIGNGDSATLSNLAPRIVGHEITHAIRQFSPDIYQALEGALRDHIDTNEATDRLLAKGYTDAAHSKAVAEATAAKDAGQIGEAEYMERVTAARAAIWDSSSRFREEMTGDIVGDHMTSARFWLDMAAKLPGDGAMTLLSKAAASLSRAIGAVRANSAMLASGQTVKNLDAAREAVATAMAEYRRRSGGKPAETTGATNESAQAGSIAAGEGQGALAEAQGAGGAGTAQQAIGQITGMAGLAAPGVAGPAGNQPADVAPAVVTNETAPGETQAPLSGASETQAPRASSAPKSNLPPNMRRNDLVGAILRVTGGDGIHSSMALDTTGDTANRQPKLRGLFTNKGTIDLGDVAMLLRESEGYDVRDGEHLSELIRQAAAGERITSMESTVAEADANKEAEYRDGIRKQAKQFGLKTAFVKFEDLEREVNAITEKRRAKLEAAMDQRSQDVFDAEMEKLRGLDQDDVDAMLLDLHQQGLRGREFQDEAVKRIRAMSEDVAYTEDANRKLQEAADDAREGEEPDVGADDNGADQEPGSRPASGRSPEAERGEGFDLSGQSNSEAAKEEADRVAAEKALAAADAKAKAEEKAAADRKAIKQASEKAASTFELGGNALDNLTGQRGIFDEPAPADKPAESDIGAMFDAAMDDVFGEAPPPAPPKPIGALSPAPTRSPAASAASAAKNAGMGLADVAKGLNTLFKPKPGTLGAGPMFDEETYAAAKPYFLAGVQHFKQSGADIAEMLKSLIVSLRDQFSMDRETIANMKPYVVRFMNDVQAGKISIGDANANEEAPVKWVLRNPDSRRIQRDVITTKPIYYDSKELAQEAADRAYLNAKPANFSNSMPAKLRPEVAKPEATKKDSGHVTDERSGTDLERNSENAAPADPMGAPGIPPADGSGDGGRRGPGVQDAETQGRAGSGDGVSGREAATAGERGNIEIYTGATELTPGSAGNSVSSGSGNHRVDGPAVEPDASKATGAAATGRIDLASKIAQQTKAPTSPDASIDDALPMLDAGQREDVAKTEARFAKPDGTGMLFTNATGTGKTFSGLGVVKRFVNAGKENILIVGPYEKVIEDWQKSGKMLGLDITALASTKDAGRGIVITTYANMGDNAALASRKWDLVVHDEAHLLMAGQQGKPTGALDALRAITMHPDGAYHRYSMLHADAIAKLAELDALAKSQRMSDDERDWHMANATQARAEVLRRDLREKQDAIRAEVKATAPADRPRAMFLSATPFAYEKATDWANGYLFDYSGATSTGRYNEGSARDQFMMQHFSYRMKTGKLTEPDARVDRGNLQRQFNAWLKKNEVLSGRQLDVAPDYDRRFILVPSAIGQRIDEALQWFEERAKGITGNDADSATQRRAIEDVRKLISDKFDYLSRRYLLEAIKAEEVIPHIREHLALGRKVVVFHDYNKGGGFNPFDLSEITGQTGTTSGDANAVNSVIGEFREEFKDMIDSDSFKASSPIITLQRAFPDLLLFNGNVPAKARNAAVAKFQDDASGPQVILLQSDAGAVGISLHDTTGKHQRVLFDIGQPTKPTAAIQKEGRIYRTGQQTDAIIRYLNTGTNWERWAFANIVANRSSTAENLGGGELARSLKDAFIEGFMESGDYRAGHEGEGKGGKERDKAANNALTEYDRAKGFYFGTQKKDSRTKAQEGTDYFATPEPIGLKMAEFADIRPGDDVLEPSAGHGAIARWFPEQSKRTAIEPSEALRSRLAMVFDGSIIGTNFESMHVTNKFDAIIMNPPFRDASGRYIDVEHVAKAATHLRDGGRIVALLQTGPAADKRLDKWLNEGEEKPVKPLVEDVLGLGPVYRGDTVKLSGFGTGASGKEMVVGDVKVSYGAMFAIPKGEKGLRNSVNLVAVASIKPTGQRTEKTSPAANFHLIADMQLPSVTFERAGTGVRAHIVVLEKQSSKDKLGTVPQQISRDYSDAATIGELFDRMEEAYVKPRESARNAEEAAEPEAKTAPEPVKVQPAGESATVEKALPGGKLLTDAPVVKHKTQAGKMLEGVIVRSMTKADAKAIDPFTWAKDGGFFVRIKHVVRPAAAEGDGDIRYSRKDREADKWLSQDTNIVGPVYYGDGFSVEAERKIPVGSDFYQTDGLQWGHTAHVEDDDVYRFNIKQSGHSVGFMDAEVNGFGEVSAIHDIQMDNPGNGIGSKVVRAITASNPDGVRVIEALNQSQPFWDKMGAGYYDINKNTRIEYTGPDPTAPAATAQHDARAADGTEQANQAGHDGARREESGRAPGYDLLPKGPDEDPAFDEVIRYSRKGKDDWHYSQLERSISEAPDKVFGPPKQVSAWLQSNAPKLGIKKDEIFWSGVTDWLGTQTGKVSKDDVLAYLKDSGVKVREVMLGENGKDHSLVIEEKYQEKIDQSANDVDDEFWRETLEEQAEKDGIEDIFDLSTSERESLLDRAIPYEDRFREIEDVFGADARRTIEDEYKYQEDDDVSTKHASGNLVLSGGTDHRELVLTVPDIKPWGESDTTHYGDTGEGKAIGWLRMNTRTDADGKKVLFIEEVQSKRAQEGRSKGFGEAVAEPNTGKFASSHPWRVGEDVFASEANARERARELSNKMVPPAPFVSDANNRATNAYITLLMKRAVTYAVDNGFDRVAWTTGDQQADRYSLAKQVSLVRAINLGGDRWKLYATPVDGGPSRLLTPDGGIETSDLEGTVGKDLAEKIAGEKGVLVDRDWNKDGSTRDYTGTDLTIGGEWARAMYGDATGRDTSGKPSLISQAVGEISKRVGGVRVDSSDLKTGSDQPGFDITPQMKATVDGEGVPLFSRKSSNPDEDVNAWQAAKAKAAAVMAPETIDKIIYELQDKHIDLKRIQEHIKELGGVITDMSDAYLGEEMYHKRLAYRTEKFEKDELLPMFAEMKSGGISKEELETFLHARHAPEANAAMAKRNPNEAEIYVGQMRAASEVRNLELAKQRAMAAGTATAAIDKALNDARGKLSQWKGSQAFNGTEDARKSLSGMSDAEAEAVMDGLSPEKRAALDSLAARVDAINEHTLDLLGGYGLMSKESLTEWRKAYQHYIPLHRDEAHPDSLSHPIGQGFSTKGDASRRRTGSNSKVTNILGHVAMQREAALTRGEKNRVMGRLYLLARQNPLPEVWKVGTVPMIDTIDKATGFVRSVPDPQYKTQPNVIMLRVGGKDVAITINEHNPQALRMAHALKNLDVDDLHYIIPVIDKATRYFASINTQYNPVFGIINLLRDTQDAALNLSSTELAGKQGDVFKDQMRILKDVLKNGGRMPKTGQWADLFAEFNRVGGATGYRELFIDAESRGKALQSAMDTLDRGGASKVVHAVGDWLSDYNEAMENSTRLAAYKAGLDNGMSQERAASLAKNLTVNFNRKGRQTRELGAFYAFFNAAVQGTARMAQTLAGPTGRKIMAGGVALGMLNTIMGIAMMGGGSDGDDEWDKIPEFVKQRSIIFPTGKKTYISLPMPLGFQFLPNIGRLAVEMAHYKSKTAGKQFVALLNVLADAFNPLGGSTPLEQMPLPTVARPIMALAENKDWTGRKIYMENRSNLDPEPGFARSKESATPWAKWLAKKTNAVTGGTDYTPGGLSPTPDQLDYVIGQLTGGIGREAGKLAATVASPFNGEELPLYKIPLVGRLAGSTAGQSGQSEKFYENLTRANEAENEIKGRAKAGLSPAEYMREHPEARALAARGNVAERQVAELRKIRRMVVAKDAPGAKEKAKAINERIAAVMTRFNREVAQAAR